MVWCNEGMRVQIPQYIYGILGMPLGHSLSPFLHSWGFSRSGHAGAFFAWEKRADELPAFFAAVRGLPVHGLCVTIPHKQAVIPFLDGITEDARKIGAVNTLYWQDEKLIGHNTDIAGFMAPLAPLAASSASQAFASTAASSTSQAFASPAACPASQAALRSPEALASPAPSSAPASRAENPPALPGTALVLGAGGAARAVLAGLRQLGVASVFVCSRSYDKAASLACDFGVNALEWERRGDFAGDGGPLLLVNATPLGMAGSNAGQSPLPECALKKMAEGAGKTASLVYDIVYNPLETPLLASAAGFGLRCTGGLDFFVAQASLQHSLWTGHGLFIEEATSLLAEKLGSA